MIMTLRVTLFLLCCSIGSMAITARDLADFCAVNTRSHKLDAQESVNLTLCMGYINGVLDTFGTTLPTVSALELDPEQGPIYPMTVKAAFLSYLKEHPDEDGKPASIVILEAATGWNLIRIISKPKP